jgi:hypothetical protein
MSDAIRRALRTFLQAFVGTFVLVAVPWATNIVTAIVNAKPYELNFDVLQSAGLAAVFAGAIALVSWVQNALEDRTAMPAIIKAPASEGQNPVPDDAAGAD